MTPQDFANQTTSWTNTLILNNVIENQVRDRYNKKNGIRSKGTPAARTPRTAVAPSGYSYTVTAAQQNTILEAYLTGLAKKNPKLAATLRPQLAKWSYDAIYAGLLSGTGLSNNNLADALTCYTVQGWMIVNNQQADPPADQIAGVRQQWANALAGSKLSSNTAARRQTAEALKIKAVLLNAGWKDAMKTGVTKDFAAIVGTNLRSEFKLDMATMSLTPAGFKAQ